MNIHAAVLFYALLLVHCSRSAVIQDDEISSFITNGENEYEFMKFYGYLEIFRGDNVYFGGSALISSKAAITVAQNVYGFTWWRVGFGGNRIRDLTWHAVRSAIYHEGYSSQTLINNIAVLIFNQSIEISPTIGPLPIPPSGANFPLTQTLGVFVGFGFGQTDVQPEILQTTTFRVTTQLECGNVYEHLVRENHLQNYFCASDPNGVSNICAGDQGGAIFSRQMNLMFGLASFIREGNCNTPNPAPVAFIRLSEYYNWLQPFFD